MMTRKTKLRMQISPQLAALDPQVFLDAGLRIRDYFKNYFSEPVAIFRSYPKEIDTSELIKSFQSVLLPRPNPEAYAQQILDAGIKLVIVPGLAFDLAGNRLGRGLGYYDRCIETLRKSAACPKIIGLCLDQQIIAEIPIEPHDQKVDGVCSQLGVRPLHHVYQS